VANSVSFAGAPLDAELVETVDDPQCSKEFFTVRASPAGASIPPRAGGVSRHIAVPVIDRSGDSRDVIEPTRRDRIQRGGHETDVDAERGIDEGNQSRPKRRGGTRSIARPLDAVHDNAAVP